MKHNHNPGNARSPEPQLVPVHFPFTHPTARTVCIAGTFISLGQLVATSRESVRRLVKRLLSALLLALGLAAFGLLAGMTLAALTIVWLWILVASGRSGLARSNSPPAWSPSAKFQT